MGVAYRFLATIEEAPVVLDWFRSLPEKPIETRRDAEVVFTIEEQDASQSASVVVVMPVRRGGVLTTVGEVHFTAWRLTATPILHAVKKRFRKWLSANPRVFSVRHGPHDWDSFLEGSVRDWDADIFALPSGMQALRGGAYFVAARDDKWLLDFVSRALERRGIKGVQPVDGADLFRVGPRIEKALDELGDEK